MTGSHPEHVRSAGQPAVPADLAAFVAAVEAASVHGAADALDLTQSAVTKRLQALERRAAVKLFERGRFGMRPTCCRDGSARFDWPSQPDMRAQVEIVNSPRVLQAVREREVQIGFVEGLDPLDGYDTLRVREDPLVVVVAADHRWARRRAISSRDLTGEPYVTRQAGSGTRAVVNDALSRAGVDLVPTLETASLQSVTRRQR